MNESSNKPVRQRFIKTINTQRGTLRRNITYILPVSNVISRVQPMTIPAILSFPKHYLQTQKATFFLPIINKRNPSSNAFQMHGSTISALSWSITQTKDLRWNYLGIIWHFESLFIPSKRMSIPRSCCPWHRKHYEICKFQYFHNHSCTQSLLTSYSAC